MTYLEFLAGKEIRAESYGFEPASVNPLLFGWQSDIVRWALKKGRACIFADCGLGKTPMQLQWAEQVSEHTGMPVLILAPLAVAAQTQREGKKFNVHVTVCREQKDVKLGVNITNYEMLEHFDAGKFSGVVLDESSILKDHSSKTRQYITDVFERTPFKLCCTATPAPNDFMELGTHAHFLGVMTQPEMLSTFFTHDGGDTSKWRLKGHATDKFFAWVASWACCITSPADLGYPADGFNLPELRIHEVEVKAAELIQDEQYMLFAPVSQTLNERRAARRGSLSARVQTAAEIAVGNEQCLVWCDLNDESEQLTAAIDGAVEVRGSQPNSIKEQNMAAFTDGRARVLVSKPSIAGWGMNWQQCHRMIFVGLSDSFEAYYQAMRRCWRFGQLSPVDVYIVISDAEGCVKANIERKQKDAERMTAELVMYTKEILKSNIKQTVRLSETYNAIERVEIPSWIA